MRNLDPGKLSSALAENMRYLENILNTVFNFDHDILSNIGVADHHAKYTDAEVDTIVATHAAIAAAHHAKYLDSEVDTILAVHTAIATAHHTKYTDAEVQTLIDASHRPILPSVDTPPASGHADNDEFDDGSIDADWGWINQVSATAVESSDTKAITMAPGSITAGHSLHILERTAPTAPYTFVMKASVGGQQLNYSTVGVCFRESATGKVMMLGVDFTTAGLNIVVIKSTNPTTYSSTPVSLPLGETVGSPIYFKLENDDTTLFFSVGDGVAWHHIFSEAKATHFTTAPDRVGMVMNQEGAARVVQIQGVFHWSRIDWVAADSLKVVTV